MSASMLRLHAIHLMRSVLAGTETKKLQDVLEAVFGTEEKETEEGPLQEEQETEASTSSGTREKSPNQKAVPSAKPLNPPKQVFVPFQMLQFIIQLLQMLLSLIYMLESTQHSFQAASLARK